MSDNPDEIINHTPNYCNKCSAAFDISKAPLYTRRQEIVIPPIFPKYIEYRAYQCTCDQCGNTSSVKSQYPVWKKRTSFDNVFNGLSIYSS